MTDLEWAMMSFFGIVAILFVIVQTYRMWNYVFKVIDKGD